MTQTLVEPETTNGDNDKDERSHFYCCDENVALCGADISTDYELPLDQIIPGEIWCVICTHTERCPICGDPLADVT